MKEIFKYSILFILLNFINSCGKKPFEVLELNIRYSNLNNLKVINILQTKNSESFSPVDTLSKNEISSSNDFTLKLLIENGNSNFILVSSDSQLTDTISGIKITRKRNNKIKSFEYKLNGRLSKDKSISIN
jgi:hypothetical protein